MGKATKDLLNEHDAILHVFDILDAKLAGDEGTAEENLKFAGELAEFFSVFADRCHHGKEENYYFEALKPYGDPAILAQIAELSEGHYYGREAITAMKAAVEAGDWPAFKERVLRYEQHLRDHIVVESSVVFNYGEKVLPEETQNDLFEKFEAFEASVIGDGIHESLHAQIDGWTEKYLPR